MILKARDDGGADGVGVVTGTVEFEVGNGPRRPANRCLRHLDDDADEGPRPGIVPQDLVPLRLKLEPADLDEPDVVRTAFEGQLPQFARPEWPPRSGRPAR